MNEFVWRQELERLETVLKEARKQYEENCEINEKLETEALETQKNLWENVGSISISNGLNQLVDFLEFVDTMKRQKRSHGFIEQLKEKYRKMLLSPYFGRFDFMQIGEQAQPYYIGISNLINDAYDILVYDWRAPVSSMFYDYETGSAQYTCPQGVISGEITLKRQYKISNGKLEYLFDSNLKIDDEMLQQLLSKSTDSKMKTIVTSIQREQNKVIRNEQYKHLIVQGAAGSGKTSIALHRVAYLLYKYRDQITPKNIVIFSPNSIFNDYISNVLPELGEDNMLQTTFEEYMDASLNVKLKKESSYDMMEYILAHQNSPVYAQRVRSIAVKSSVEFLTILKKYVAHVEANYKNFPDIVAFGKPVITAAELRKLFEQDYSSLTLKWRLEQIRSRALYLLKNREEQRVREITAMLNNSESSMNSAEIQKESISIVRNETREARETIESLTCVDALRMYRQLFEGISNFVGGERAKELREIRKYTLENLNAGQLYYEDQIALLYLQGALGVAMDTSAIKFVIIDEAQDYSPLQYEIFHQLFRNANITMLGDISQSINPYMKIGDYDNISHIFPPENTLLLHLNKSYRSTVEITRFARRILQTHLPEETVERHGDEPLLLPFSDGQALTDRIAKDIRAFTEKGYRSVGILARTKNEADDAYRLLKDKAQVSAIVSGNQEYVRGAVVMPAYLAKGLEFDAVILYNAGNGNYSRDEERLLLYTACTRALHVLHIYHTGERSPLLPHTI